MVISRTQLLAETMFQNQDDVIAALESFGKSDLVKKMRANQAMLTSIIENCQTINILDLPIEIIVMILCKLTDLVDLLTAKLVCKTFNAAIPTPSVSLLNSITAGLPIKVLEKYLDSNGESLSLTFHKNEEIKIPKNLKQVIESGQAMPKLKKIEIHGGRPNSNLLTKENRNVYYLPRNVHQLAFHCVKEAIDVKEGNLDIGHLEIFEVHFADKEKLLKEDADLLKLSWLYSAFYGLKAVNDRTALAVNSRDKSGKIQELMSHDQFKGWLDVQVDEDFDWGFALGKAINGVILERVPVSDFLGARLRRVPGGLNVTIFVP